MTWWLLLFLPLVYGRISFHNVNDFHADGSVCGLETFIREDVPCPIVCVSDIVDCPSGLKPSDCPSGQFYCQDGSCRAGSTKDAACQSVTRKCSCSHGFSRSKKTVDSNADLYPCLNDRVNVSLQGISATLFEMRLLEQCDNALKSRNINVSNDPKKIDPFVFDCLPVPFRQLESQAPEFIFFYIFISTEFLILLGYFVYKRSAENGSIMSPVRMSKAPLMGVESESAVELQNLNHRHETDAISFLGYRKDKLGNLAKLSVILSSFIWILFLLLLVMDYYGVFASVGGTEFMVFNNHDTLSRVFIFMWHIVTAWFIGLKLSSSRFSTYFAISCSLDRADMVLVEKQMEQAVYMSGMGKLVEWIRRVEKYFDRYVRSSVSVHVLPIKLTSKNRRYIEFECVRYLFDDRSNTFEEYIVTMGVTKSDLFRHASQGLTTEDVVSRQENVGLNAVTFEGDTFWSGIKKEFSGFFYIYQMMCLWIWYYYAYYYMGLVLTGVIVISGLVKVGVALKSQKKVLKMASFHGSCHVKRDGGWVTVDTKELVPGDIMEIVTSEHPLSADVVILEGGAVADESSLTGEALPVAKFSVKNERIPFHMDKSKINCLYAGCKVLQVQYPDENPRVTALVLATGANTSKGRLVKDILFPSPISFVFTEHLKLVFVLLILWGIVMLLLSIVMLGAESVDSWFYGMFTISQILSPLLPAVLVIGQSVASERLRKKGIMCVDLNRITLGGKVKVFCFDKTGTLTKEGLDFRGVHPVVNPSGIPDFQTVLADYSLFPSDMRKAMQVSHSLTLVGSDFVGNFVDIEMFRATGARLHVDHGGSGTTIYPQNEVPISIVKRFEFVHSHAYMSVVAYCKGDAYCQVFLKGSHEKIKELVNPGSLPVNYDEQAAYHSSQGCYVLAVASKIISADLLESVDTIGRDELEQDADFIGFLLFRNELKPDTQSALDELRDGGCRLVMITGDNANTAVYIARESGMIQHPQDSVIILGDVHGKGIQWKVLEDQQVIGWDTLENYLAAQNVGGRRIELAVTGKAFNVMLMDGNMRRLLLNTRIFARMSPSDKVQCVRLHMEKAITAMCGDGGNDAGALKASHAGIALSEAESSVVSHFSSRVKSIMSCVTLLKESRCSLDVSFASYKYLLMYGETLAFVGLIQYYFMVNMSQATWILIDGSTVPLSWALTLAQPALRLTRTRPTAKLLGIETCASVAGQVMIDVVFQVISILLLFGQPWFLCHEFDATKADLRRWWELSDNYEAEVTGIVVTFQILHAAAVFNLGSKYRQGFLRNYGFLLIYSAIFALLSYILVADPNSLGCLFRVNCGTPIALNKAGYAVPALAPTQYYSASAHNVMPFMFRIQLWILCFVNLIALLIYENFVVLGPFRRRLAQKTALRQGKLEIKC